MKNIFKYTFVALLSVLALTACTNEYEYDAPSATEQGGNATISAATTSFVFVPGETQECKVTVTRVNDTEAEEIGLTCDNTNFTVPSSVSFSAGEKAKEVTITSSLDAGSSEVANISIAQTNAFIYGANTITISVNVYRMFDAVIQTAMYGDDPWDAVIYELGAGSYMIPDAFAEGYDLKFSIDFNTNKVTIPAQYIDYYSDTYGPIAMSTSTATYDPETLLITATSTFSLPYIEYTFGTVPLYIVFGADPQQ